MRKLRIAVRAARNAPSLWVCCRGEGTPSPPRTGKGERSCRTRGKRKCEGTMTGQGEEERFKNYWKLRAGAIVQWFGHLLCRLLTWVGSPTPHMVPQTPPRVILEHGVRSKAMSIIECVPSIPPPQKKALKTSPRKENISLWGGTAMSERTTGGSILAGCSLSAYITHLRWGCHYLLRPLWNRACLH